MERTPPEQETIQIRAICSGERLGGICPYLGRRQHPAEVYDYSTGHNVCYARPGGDRSYSHVDRGQQVRACLEPGGGWPLCRTYIKAVSRGIPAPRDLPPDAGQGVVTRKRRRKRRTSRRQWLALAKQALSVIAVLVFSALLGYILAGR